MCGIVGYIGDQRVVQVLIEGLRRLEYRGYDSAGIALVKDGELHVRRSPGKLQLLEQVLVEDPVDGEFGIGHTRWATHGRPTEENAHPHRDCTGNLTLVHNGIIENYLELKDRLQSEGHRFDTETDTEIVAHLVESYYDGNLEAAMLQALPQLRGIYSLVAMSTQEENKIVGARLGPPLVVGLGDNEYFVASDIPAILHHTRDVFFLDDREMVTLTKDGVRLQNYDGQEVQREAQRINWDPIQAEKGGYKHFMLKEIY